MTKAARPPLSFRFGGLPAGPAMRARTALGLGALPNAIIVGAMKCGTTSLFDYLVQHPEVCGSRTKELHFFDNQFDKGPRWYRANFAPRRGQKVILESSPYYFFHPLAPQRAAALVPDAKLILLLRNPIDRAYSHFNQNREERLEPLSFEEALDREEERLAGTEAVLAEGRVAYSHAHQTFSYVAKGLYADQLARWLTHFPREQLLIAKAEDLFRSPQHVVDEVAGFLGIEPRPIGDLGASNQRRYPLMHPATRARLEERFEAPNEALRGLAGISWPKRKAQAALTAAEIDLASAHLLADPHSGYKALREIGQVVHLPRQGFWIVLGHAEATFALSRPDLLSSAPYRGFDPALAGADPPEHGQARAALSRALTPELLDQAVRAAARVAAAGAAPRFDGVRDIAAPAARAAAAALAGFAPDHLARIPDMAAGPVRELIAAVDAVAGKALLARTLGEDADGRLSPEQARRVVRSLWLATATTLERLVGHAVLRLAAEPDLRPHLSRDGALLAAFIDEVARLHPTEHMISRAAAAPFILAGQTIPAGARVEICVSAANRDPALFEDPAALRLHRPANRHLSFGGGPHACLGAELGRRAAAAAIGALLEAAPALRLQPPPEAPQMVRSMRSIVPVAIPLLGR